MTTDAAAAPLSTASPSRRFTSGRTAVVGAVLLLLVIGLGYVAYAQFLARPVAQPIAGQPTQVRRGSVAATVSATGSVVASRQSRLAMLTAGRLKEVQVKLGDQVRAGAVLAKLDTTPLELKLAQTQSALRVNQIKLEQLKTGARPEEIAAAEAGVRSAQAKLDDLQGGTTAQDIAQAQAAIDSAAANLRAAQSKLGDVAGGATAQDVAQAQAAVDSAASSVRSAQARIDAFTQGPGAADLAAAEQSVAAAQSAAQRAETDLARVKAGATAEEMRSAEIALEQARNSLWSQQINRDATCGRGVDTAACKSANASVASAESSVSQALAKIEALRAKPDPRDVETAEAAARSAREALRSAQARLEQVKSGGTEQERVQAQAALDGARANYRSAVARLEGLRAGARSGELQSAQAAVESAQANYQTVIAKLETLRAGPKSAEIQAALSGLAQAQATLAAKKAPATAQDLALAEEQVKQSEIAVRQAQIDLDNATLTAPFDGSVGAITANVGEQVGGGTALLTIVDPKAVRIDVSVDETDIAKITAAKTATITFDALPERRFAGKVMGIAPAATIQQGVATYAVSVSVDDVGDTILPPGLTANVSIVVAQRDNVLLVPNRAIKRQGRNQVVDVLVGDKAETRQIKTGLGNDQFTEVVEGVAEGDQVVIPTTTTQVPRVGGFGGPGGQAGAGGPPPGGGPQFVTKPVGGPAKP